MPEPFQRLLTSTADLETPFAVVDEPALWANADDLVRRAAEVPIRVASKSVRVRSIIDRTLAREGFTGVMSYSLAESNWLVDNGIDDVPQKVIAESGADILRLWTASVDYSDDQRIGTEGTRR